MQFIKRFYKQLSAVVAAIVGLVLLRQFFTKDLLAKLRLANTDKQSAVLDSKQEEIRKDIAKEQELNQDLRDKTNQPSAKATPSEVEKFWNKN
jgi:hypothetical protein